MKKIIFLAILVIGFLTVTCLSAHEQTWPGRRLAKLWPEAKSFVRVQRQLSEEQIGRIEKIQGASIFTEDRSPTFYYAYETFDKKKRLGLILFLDAYGPHGKMEISLGMTTDGKVAKLNIWQHSEGESYNSPDFLSKFLGKTFLDFLSPEPQDAVTLAVRRGLLITTESFGVNVAELTKKAQKDEKKE